MRVSTAVLLTRGTGEDLEIFLVRRSKKLRFFGGYWAFPGGVVDRSDWEGGPDEDGTHQRCGARELFEETGVLPGSWYAAFSEPERLAQREALLSSEGEGADAFFELSHVDADALRALRPFARLTTPKFAPVRYRTRFLHFEMPREQVPDVWPGELTEGEFAPASKWLKRWREGTLAIAPPVVFLLEMLNGATLEDFLDRAERRCSESEAGRLHLICNTPGILMTPLPTVTLPPATTTNCYIVGEERLFVVDPATREDAAKARLFDLLDERLARPGTEPALGGVLVTHHHADHVGAVDAVAKRYACPVYAHPLTLERLPVAPADPRPLNDGDQVALGMAPDGTPGWTLRAYHTPGHDRGHLVFVDNRYHSAIAGDLASTVSTILIDPPEGHLATYLASLRRMLGVPMGMLHPAHGPVARKGHRLLSSYLDHRAQRETSLVAALENGPMRLEQLVAQVYRDAAPELHGLASRSLLAGLEKLVEEGRALPREDGSWASIPGVNG